MPANKISDSMFRAIVRKYGFWAALRFARNLGIGFHDCYFMVFGRLPQCDDIPFGGIRDHGQA